MVCFIVYVIAMRLPDAAMFTTHQPLNLTASTVEPRPAQPDDTVILISVMSEAGAGPRRRRQCVVCGDWRRRLGGRPVDRRRSMICRRQSCVNARLDSVIGRHRVPTSDPELDDRLTLGSVLTQESTDFKVAAA